VSEHLRQHTHLMPVNVHFVLPRVPGVCKGPVSPMAQNSRTDFVGVSLHVCESSVFQSGGNVCDDWEEDHNEVVARPTRCKW
jgi:hypothetical protein